MDNKSGKELRQYLAHLSEQTAAGDNSVLPCVVVLDNLHKAGLLADALGSLPRNLPCLLGKRKKIVPKLRIMRCFFLLLRYNGTIRMFSNKSPATTWI